MKPIQSSLKNFKSYLLPNFFTRLSIILLLISSKEIIAKQYSQDVNSSTVVGKDCFVCEEDSEPYLSLFVPSGFREGDSVGIVSKDVPGRREVLTVIMDFMGTRYRENGTDTSGFDCSGFTARIIFEVYEIILPHSVKEQYTLGRMVLFNQLQFGDLVFFGENPELPSHVGIYIGDGLFAHASIHRGVTISLLNDKYFMQRFTGGRRITEKKQSF